MRAIVVGAGDVGFDVARLLSLQQHDVTVVERDAARAGRVREALDVLVLEGSGTSAALLRRAGVAEADLVVAVTDVDEVNLVVAMLARRLGPPPTTIVRVRSDELTGEEATLDPGELGVDLLIRPEESTAAEVVALLRRAAASDVVDLAGGRLQLVGLRIESGNPVVGRRLEEIARAVPHLAFRVAGIARGARTLLPRGDERLQREDQVFVVIEAGQVPQVVHAFGKSGARLDRVMMLGGSPVAERIVARLGPFRRNGLRLTIVEPDPARARRVAEAHERTLVLQGAPDDIDLLAREGLAEMDALVAVTPDEETNLVTSLLAKHLGVRKTVALLSKAAYVPLSRAIGLDAAVSTKLAVTREVMRFLRGTRVASVTTVLGLDAEILEFVVRPGAPATRGPLRTLRVPKGALVAAVVRDGTAEVATGSTHLRPGDRVTVFVLPGHGAEVEAWLAP